MVGLVGCVGWFAELFWCIRLISWLGQWVALVGWLVLVGREQGGGVWPQGVGL